MRLPARFQPKHVARNMPLAKLARKVMTSSCPSWADAVPHAQSPQRRQTSAAGKQVVALHGMEHVGTGDDIHVHAPRRRDIDTHKSRACGGRLRRRTRGTSRTGLRLPK